MKVKLDFISNSSSTSFVYISDVELTEEAFLEAAGVDKKSPVADLFSDMYYEINGSIKHGEKLESKEEVDNISGRHEFTPEVLEKMKAAIAAGQTVVTSSLSSDGALAESALCMEIFEVESEAFYINAYSNYW